MGTRYLFNKALKITQNLAPSDRIKVLNLCRRIKKSQEDLLAAADTALFYCIEKCHGLCCRNLDIDTIFSLWDFIFILLMQPWLKEEMQKRLFSHQSLYLAPCPFLVDSKGPCIFPDGIKAQICVVTFCSNDQNLISPVKVVNYNFYKLCWLIQFLRIKGLVKKVTGG